MPGNDSNLELKVVFCASKNPEGLQKRTPFEMSLYYPADDAPEGPLPAIKNGKPVGLYFTNAMDELVKQIKSEIENAIVDIDNHPPDLYHENNRALLVSLALSGNDLFVNHLGEDIQGHLQIVSNRREFVPLDLVYTIPPPAPDATVCKHAKEALLEGKCRGCYDKTVSPAPHICPFGFWSFSRVVERHSFNKKIDGGSGDYFIMVEPADVQDGKLQVLRNIMYASSSKVDAAGQGLIQQVADSIKENNILNRAVTWKEWTDSTEKNNPDTLVLMVHVEKRLNKYALEIGEDLLIKNYIDQKYIRSTQSKAPPFIIVIGCEVANVEDYGFDIGSHFMNIGAAAVVSNFTKIRGRQAGPVVMKLVEFLRSKKGEDISLGEIMLKLRQYLLANGIMVGLALTAYGDADWKLNT